ncbi:MAG: hypothetical protein WA709_37095 [Stellaceae bacterium]
MHCIQKPAVIRRVQITAHELVFNDIITRADLAMGLALIVIPDPSAPPREHRLDAQQACHCRGLKTSALRVDQRNALSAKFELGREILRGEYAIMGGESVHPIESRLEEQIKPV